MDLKTFVAESLKQIAEGIRDAQAADTGAWIAPKVFFTEKGKMYVHDVGVDPTPQMITFDVAVTVTETDALKGGGGMTVLGISLGGSAETATQNAAVSRVKFEVPVVWPMGTRPF